MCWKDKLSPQRHVSFLNLVSFRPGVAWSTLCLPRKFGWCWSWLNIANQSLALYLVYLQRLLRPPSGSDFVTAWLVYAFQVYTGHKSVLPWLLFPDKYKCRVSTVPVLNHLCKLMLKLPKLLPAPEWSPRWYLDLPLCCILSPVSSGSNSLRPSSIAPRYLLSDISTWQPDLGIVDCVTSRNNLPRTLRRVDLAVRPGWNCPASLHFDAVIESSLVLSHDKYYNMPEAAVATWWMPDCSHWTISNSSCSSVSVARLSLGALRRYWHPARDIITCRMGPPLLLPVYLRLRPPSWRLFWSLPLPAKAFKPWWRLLHDRIAHRSWCHRITQDKVPSPVCALCGVDTKDLYHFVVGYSLKAEFWRGIVFLLSLRDLLPSSPSIWCAQTSFCTQEMIELDEEVLVALGAAFTTLWKYHWRCAIDSEPWMFPVAMNMFRQDRSLLYYSFSSLSSASVQVGTLALP
ncbi:hypothetical protein [Parasitella parasitica]|uniref:Reverse transcriptase zinc-binding domain-containing protein n=1 Tax=Parasitella parasitica TaxID=35722 RepID=A0A0B7MZ45_9FUNG|nr:hypothetical protein [Parasitella parasitica]